MRKHLLKLFALAVLLLSLLSAAAAWMVLTPVALAREQIDFTISPGSSMRTAAREVAAAGADIDPWILIMLGKLMRADTSIKAGSYEIVRGITAVELLKKLTRGDVTQAQLAFIEGWTFRQIRERLDAHPDLGHDTRDLSEAQIMALIGAPETTAEGLFFPDTYFFAKRSRDVDLLARAYRSMQQHLVRLWEARAPELPYRDPYQALIMASIIEKETGRDDDRPLVAGVFVNRLRQRMLLQTDPTVIYGLGETFDGNLRRRDLLADTPYNTYIRPGLPPTPIAMPGLASLQAALQPPPTEALYFVARGDGSSQFSPTLEEHNRAVRRFQKGGNP